MTLMCISVCFFVFFFKQKTAYELRISDWSSDVCSSDLAAATENGLTTQNLVRGPSFEQAVKQAQRKLIQGQDYAGIQMVRARGEAAEAQVTFAPTDRKSVV